MQFCWNIYTKNLKKKQFGTPQSLLASLHTTRCNDVAFYALSDKDLTFFEYMGRIFGFFFSTSVQATRNLDQVPWTEVTFISGVKIFMDDIRYWVEKKTYRSIFHRAVVTSQSFFAFFYFRKIKKKKIGLHIVQ